MGVKESNYESVETEYKAEGGISLDVGGGEEDVKQTGGEGASLEFDRKTPPEADSTEPSADTEADEAAPETDTDRSEGEDDEDSDPQSFEDLGEYKAEDAEKWDKTYTKEGGLLNTDRLSSEWWANKKDADTAGKLHEGTYRYLEGKGFAREDVDAIGAALEAQAETIQSGLAERAGGADALANAIKWGREGGYSKDQIARFNKAMSSNKLDLMQEAVDLLAMRYAKANPQPVKRPPAAKPKETRGSAVPKTTEGVEKYKDMDEQISAGIAIRKIKDPVARKRAYDNHFAKML